MTATTPSKLDVRTIAHEQRHATIIGVLDDLALGETLILLVDHQPRGLYADITSNRPGEVSWADAEITPGEWEATFTKVARVLDVRPIIDAGGEPFETIMNAVGELEDEDLVIVAPFEPTPLEGVLSSQGFSFEANEVEPGHWRTRFSLGA